jgi:hypothetical protein
MSLEAEFAKRCSLASEADVGSDSALESASCQLSLSLPYCQYLMIRMLRAAADAEADVTTATTADDISARWQPQHNVYTVFCETWHAASLATLTNADIANAWRLADYLLLDAACCACLADVATQRQLRTGVPNALLSVLHADRVCVRLEAALALLSDSLEYAGRVEESKGVVIDTPRVVRGLDVPTTPHLMRVAARWGHLHLLLLGRAAGLALQIGLVLAAASNGQLRLLRQLQRLGSPWGESAIWFANFSGHSDTAARWLLACGEPVLSTWPLMGFNYGRLALLQWAWRCGRLPRKFLPQLRTSIAESEESAEPGMLEWLNSLLSEGH